VAGAGIGGTEDAPLDGAGAALALSDEDPAAVFGLSERPGATAATNPAKPAVSAAAPTITQRRVRLTRASAASRISTARERSRPPVFRYSFLMFESTIGRDCQRSVRAI
jgi:hypothetical protein